MQKSGKSTKRLDRLARKQAVSRDPGVILGFRWSKCNQKFEECHDLQRKNENKLYKNEMHK